MVMLKNSVFLWQFYAEEFFFVRALVKVLTEILKQMASWFQHEQKKSMHGRL